MTDPFPPSEPHAVPGGIDSEADLVVGADDSPDILAGTAEDEADLGTVTLHDTPFRTPHAGQHLSEDELERDLDGETTHD
jgi:hypothetical protein